MKLTRCENGHFYDEERFATCPHCSQPAAPMGMGMDGESTIGMDQFAPAPAAPMGGFAPAPAAPMGGFAPMGGGVTVPLGPDGKTMPLEPLAPTEPLSSNFDDEDDGNKTVGYYDDFSGGTTEPVVGWVVAIDGPHRGKDFALKTGRNFVGRSNKMDIALTNDPSISRDRHAILLYEPKASLFLVQPGDSRELFYLNDKVVLTAAELKPYDVLSLGKTKLMFVPFCTEQFNWENI